MVSSGLLKLVVVQRLCSVASGGAFYPSMPSMSPAAVKVRLEETNKVQMITQTADLNGPYEAVGDKRH